MYFVYMFIPFDFPLFARVFSTISNSASVVSFKKEKYGKKKKKTYLRGTCAQSEIILLYIYIL